MYYVGLIAWVGCHIDAYEQAKWFGDDMALKADVAHVDMVGLPAMAFTCQPCRRRPRIAWSARAWASRSSATGGAPPPR